MPRYSTFCLILLCFFCACKKTQSSKSLSPENKIKIEIISGNNQADTIGHLLKGTVVLKVTKSNLGLKNRLIKAERADCVYLPYSDFLTDNNGLAQYKWELNGKTGDQTVRFTIYDSLNIAQDSVVAHAEGKYYNNAWQTADCLPHVGINDICQSSSGRLFCALHSFDMLYYSDNGGVGWQKLISFPLVNKEIQQLVAQGNEIFIATRHDGVYYSPDNGTTWQNRSSGITDTREIAKLGITRSGKLFLSNYYNKLYTSSDKGLHWIPIVTIVDFNAVMSSFCETSSGVLYMVSNLSELYKSTTGGISWTKIHPSVSYSVQSVFVDDNDDLYFGSFSSTADVYKSTNGGSTWTRKYSSPIVGSMFLRLEDFFKVNGIYYFMIGGYGIVKTQDFSTFRLLTDMYSQEYLVGNGNSVYVPGPFNDLWYNINP